MTGALASRHVALGAIAVNGITALGVMWVIGNRVARELVDFGSALPSPTRLALDVRSAATVLVFVMLALGVVVHRSRGVLPLLVSLALVPLFISAWYGWALWLPYMTGCGGPIK